MINEMNNLGAEAAMVWNVYLMFPNHWLPKPVIPGVNVESAIDLLISMNMVEVEKNDSGEYFYRVLVSPKDIMISKEQMPSVYGRVVRIIDEGKYEMVKKVLQTTPLVAKRWEKIEYITDPILEELISQMDAYIRRQNKRYKDLTRVLRSWEQRRTKKSTETSSNRSWK